MNKFFQIICFICISVVTPHTVKAHGDGHGPKLSDTGFFGGIVTAVIKESDHEKGIKALLVYKAELVRTNDGTARVYLYDSKMKLLNLTDFSKIAKASLISFVDGKKNTAEFSLTLIGKNFIGKAPKEKSKPFNLDIIFEEKGIKYLAAFDHLD